MERRGKLLAWAILDMSVNPPTLVSAFMVGASGIVVNAANTDITVTPLEASGFGAPANTNPAAQSGVGLVDARIDTSPGATCRLAVSRGAGPGAGRFTIVDMAGALAAPAANEPLTVMFWGLGNPGT